MSMPGVDLTVVPSGTGCAECEAVSGWWVEGSVTRCNFVPVTSYTHTYSSCPSRVAVLTKLTGVSNTSNMGKRKSRNVTM